MNRAMYIVGIVFSVAFFVFTGVLADEAQSARSYYYYSNYGSPVGLEEMTLWGAAISLVIFLIFTYIYIRGLVKIKTMTTKVLSIIGLSVTGIFLLWDGVMLSEPNGISFDEVAPGWVLYCLMSLAFMIVGLVQAVKFKKRDGASTKIEAEDILDS